MKVKKILVSSGDVDFKSLASVNKTLSEVSKKDELCTYQQILYTINFFLSWSSRSTLICRISTSLFDLN